jgi:hypothetical protein
VDAGRSHRETAVGGGFGLLEQLLSTFDPSFDSDLNRFEYMVVANDIGIIG